MINMLKVLIGLFVLLMILAFAFLGKQMWKFFLFRTAKTKREESEWIMWIAAIATLSVSIADFVQEPTAPTTWKVIGAYLFLMGGIFQIIAKRALKKNTQHEAMKENFHTATSYGIYHRLRHPSKTGLFFMVLGVALGVGSTWGTIIALFLFTPALFYRISCEEKELLDEYGDRYYDYQDTTNKLIPFIL